MRVAVLGAGGRMGATVCRALEDDDRFELVAAVDPTATGHRLDEVAGTASRLVLEAGLEALTANRAEAVVDFTVAAAARQNLPWCAAHGVHVVCGTTGLSAEDLERFSEVFGASDANCVVASNFGLTAVLLMRFAEQAAAVLDAVEIIELHHDQKRDAPSGTAIETARRIPGARGHAFAEPEGEEVLTGARGATGPGGIHIHAVRLPGLVAHEEVIFGGPGQALTIRQDSFDRTSFMPGVLLAVAAVAHHPGLTVGLDALLGWQPRRRGTIAAHPGSFEPWPCRRRASGE